MNLADSAKEMFNRNTRNELREFCRELGIRVPPAAGADLLRRSLLEKLQLADTGTSTMRKDSVVRYRARNEIVPGYNLTPNGVWEGRRHRIRLAKPFDATKSQRGELVSWNGKNPYRVPFNEVEAVPEPIYNRLKEIQRHTCIAVQNERGEQYTDFVFEPKFAMDHLGIDPDTADRCGSLTEWYQQKGPTWLRERELGELETIADLCQIERVVYRTGSGEPRTLNKTELTRKLMISFFSFPDVADEPEPEPQPQATGKKPAAGSASAAA